MQYLGLSRIISEHAPRKYKICTQIILSQRHSEYLKKLSRICTLNEISRIISDFLWPCTMNISEGISDLHSEANLSHLRFASDFSPNINLYTHASNKLHSLLKSRSFSTFIINYFSASPTSYKSNKPTT